MKAVVFERFGDPAEVLQVREVPEAEPGPGQVRVRMLASPIGPADFLTVRGEYGHRPKLPATPGTEGVGIVEAGRGLLGRIRVGRRVAVLNETGGNWQEKCRIGPARGAHLQTHPGRPGGNVFYQPRRRVHHDAPRSQGAAARMAAANRGRQHFRKNGYPFGPAFRVPYHQCGPSPRGGRGASPGRRRRGDCFRERIHRRPSAGAYGRGRSFLCS